jgi:hypothetical protein
VHLALLVLALSLLLSGPALATEDADEMRNHIEELVARNAWSGADRAYETLVDSGIRLTGYEHFLAGRAALALGKINRAVERFEQAQKSDQKDAATEMLAQINGQYGTAKLKLPASHKGGVPLRARDPQIDPVFRLVVEQAKKTLEADGSYSGLMPLGRYKLGQTAFEVTGDKPVKAKLS